jgi:outer membrane protein OmpA-like peptidoglycan-associated protein
VGSKRAGVRDRYERLLADLHRLESDVPFKTNEAVLSSEATERLRALGTVLAGLPQAKVRVTGFADPRGGKRQNIALSERRANAVVTVLSQAGVRNEQIVIEARGAADASPDATTLDDYALERRASVRLEPDGAAMSAQRVTPAGIGS